MDQDRGDNEKFVCELDNPSQAFEEGDGNLVLKKPELFDCERIEKVVVRVLAMEETPSRMCRSRYARALFTNCESRGKIEYQ